MNTKKTRQEEIRRLSAQFPRLIEWSNEDGCYVGSAPPLVGQCCQRAMLHSRRSCTPLAIARMGAIMLATMVLHGCESSPLKAGDAGRGGSGGMDPSGSSGGGAIETGGSTGPTTPLSELEGIWLVGWAGGLRHYSWIRFKGGSPGRIQINDGDDLNSNAPYWGCNGTGSWTASGSTLTLLLPSPCAPETIIFQFSSQQPPSYGESLHLTVRSNRFGGALDAFKFEDSRCDKTMASCADPFVVLQGGPQ